MYKWAADRPHAHFSHGVRRMSMWHPVAKLDDFEKEEDEDYGEDEAEPPSTVVAETWTHAVTTETEQQNQDNQKDEHLFLRSRKSSFVLCDADFVRNVMV